MRLCLETPAWAGDMGAFLALTEASASYNELLVRRGRVGLLYEAGVVYQTDPPDEPWYFADAVQSRGAGDCEDLVAWRVAELRVLGARAVRPDDPLAAVVTDEKSLDAFGDMLVIDGQIHAVVHVKLHGFVYREDPSRRLGMLAGLIDPPVRERWHRAGQAPRATPRWSS